MKKLNLFLLPALLLFLVPFNDYTKQNKVHNLNSSWKTTDWEIKCFQISEASLGDYYNDESGDDCSYTKRADGSTYVISEQEKDDLKNYLKSASEQLQSYGYLEPILDSIGSKWKCTLYPPHCYCNLFTGGCCQSKNDQGKYKFNEQGDFGFYKNGSLVIKCEVDTQENTQAPTAAHELFHAVATNHLDVNPTSMKNFKESDETKWIHEGGAEGYGIFWAKTANMLSQREQDRKYDTPLFTGEGGTKAIEAYSTYRFWKFIADKANSFEYMKHILDEDYSTSKGKVKGGVHQVNEGLIKAGYEKGLYEVFKSFVKETLDKDKWYSGPVKEKEITKAATEVAIQTKPIDPIAVQAVKFKIHPNQFEEEDLEQKQVVLKIKLKDDSDLDIHLFYKNEEVNGEKSFEITEEFRESLKSGEPMTAFVYLANINLVAEDSEKKQSQEVVATVELLECPMVPKGLLKMVYENTSTNGEKSLRVTYDLDSDKDSKSMEGEMKVNIYSYELEKEIAETDLVFECTTRGVVLQGPEFIYLPEQITSTGYLDMSIATNTNIIPHKPEVGSDLDDANVIVNAETTNDLAGLIFMTIDNQLTNRRVVKKETITVQAGTFECYRIEFSSQSRFEFGGAAGILNMFKRKLERASHSKNVIWVTENYGWVKQEIKNNEGTSYFELISLTEG